MSFESIKTIPPVGFGLWKTNGDICEATVFEAIRAGYRHLDSACDYDNEVDVGNGIQRAIAEGVCTLEELWITYKLWNPITRQSMPRSHSIVRLMICNWTILISNLFTFPLPLSLCHSRHLTRRSGFTIRTMRQRA